MHPPASHYVEPKTLFSDIGEHAYKEKSPFILSQGFVIQLFLDLSLLRYLSC